VETGVRAETTKPQYKLNALKPTINGGGEGGEGAVSGELKIFGQKTAMGQWSDTNCVFCFVSSP